MNCRFCGKSFNRGFNLRRHESEYCSLQDHNSSIESGFDQSTGISTKIKYADTDDSTSESDSDHSDYTDEDQENEHETDPWASLKMETMTKNMPEFQELTETFTADGLEEEEARDKVYLTILPKLRKDLQSIYLQSCAKIFGKSMFFSFLGIYGLISPPTPISMLKNVISVLREMESSK